MPAIDIPAAKRAGLPVDLERLTTDGDDWLSPEERYALKQHGVCPQAQPGMFMIRIRTGNGVLPSAAARGLASLAATHGRGWVHLTTRQQVELHHVEARSVTTVLAGLADHGLTSSSTCGHAVRGVMSCPDAGVGLAEPFDCHPDAEAVSEAILALAPGLNHRLPQRLNIAFGGCPDCRAHAQTNDLGFVSTVGEDGALGYELLLGGSLGRSAPTLARQAVGFLPRRDVVPAVHALLEVFCEHGNFEQPNKARLKFLVRKLGWEAFRALFLDALATSRTRAWPEPCPVATPEAADVTRILAASPPGGWSSGVRPTRAVGRALATVRVPLGDVDAEDLDRLADLADRLADGTLVCTPRQNVTLGGVPLAAIPELRASLADLGLGLDGPDQAADVRCCTGGPVCALALTPAQAAAEALHASPALARHGTLRVALSGCNNACAQQQVADIGFSAGKVTVRGESMLGYQVWVGGDLAGGRIAQVVGRIAERDVPAITEAIVGTWEALGCHGERLGDTVERVGTEAFTAQIGAVFAGRWEPGPEPPETPEPAETPVLVEDRRLPLVEVA